MSDTSTPTFNFTGFDGIITRFAFLLVAEKDGVVRCYGTGIRVVPGIGLAARHVIEEYAREFGFELGEGHASFALSALYVAKSPGNELRIYRWAIPKFHLSDVTDIALLHLQSTSTDQEESSPINLLMQGGLPDVGSVIRAFGYPRTSSELGDHHLAFTTDPTTSSGVVTAVYPKGRDRVMLPFPCYEVNARFDAAMSGGPVFVDGKLAGLLVTLAAG
jgi:hypothetical protein